MTKPLSETEARQHLRDFFREKPLVFFGTGLSCALDSRFGMPALKDALLSNINENGLTDAQKIEWSNVKTKLLEKNDLENALNEVSNHGLLSQIVACTGRFISQLDKEHSYNIATKKSFWPGTMLIKKMVDTLSDKDCILHVLTPNYDLLFEYACESANITYTNGFIGCVHKRIDWSAAERSMQYKEASAFGKNNIRYIDKDKKHVRLHKVHGSLNYFYHNDELIENNSWTWDPPEFAQRIIITPGLSKYEVLQKYRQELLTRADSAISSSSSFLFLGYGFNDNHLEEYIKRKLISQASHGLIITRSINEKINTLLQGAKNLWVVCAEGDNSANSKIFNSQYDDWLILPGVKIWDVQEFYSDILGG